MAHHANASIDYYLSLNSPWTYLGHERLVALARRHGVAVVPRPVDYRGVIFPATGGVPVTQRAPQRQAWRLLELARWRDHLGITLNLHPRHWPADEELAARTVLACRESGGDAVRLAGTLLCALWAEERDIADRDTLLTIAAANRLDGPALLAAADTQHYATLRRRESQEAVERGVFGAPSYLLHDELFWGQDRLGFLDRALSAALATRA